MRWVCCFAIFIMHAAYAGQIITTNDFSDIEIECSSLNRNSLLLFDVDATLIVPNDAILKPKGKSFFEKLVADYTDRDLFREIRMKAPHSVVDSRSVDFIRMLQKRQVPILALTAAPAKVKGLEGAGNWRVDELRQFGFDFQNSLPQDNCITLPKSEQYQQSPMFKLGVLYSSFHPKGDVLIAFLQHLNLSPEKIIFVDDELKHVQSVISCLDKAGIQCVGIHYIAANEMPCDLNPQLARFQVSFFAENDVWLSDKEGLSILFDHPEHSQIK